MDIALSIISGLGLRIFLFTLADPRVSNKLTAAVLGIWEGIVLHQVSGRSSSPSVDHFLGYGLRLAVDFFVSKNLQRVIMLVLWSALSAIASEVALPHTNLRSTSKKRETRRHRHSRSTPDALPASAPLPPRVRAYKPPDQNQLSHILPDKPPLQTSTPLLPTDQPPTPPSFFLHETNVSPSPKPVYLPTLHSADSSPRDVLPVRPRSGLASTFNHSPNSDSPLPVPNHLPTPPDSAQSGNILSDVLFESHNDTYDNQILGFAPDLAPIPELSSPENNTTPHGHDNRELEAQHIDNNVLPNDVAQRVPKWLESTSDPDAPIFLRPFSPIASPASDSPAAALPVPMPIRQQTPLQTPSPAAAHLQQAQLDEMDFRGDIQSHEDEGYNGHDTDVDELRTPGAQYLMNMETDNEYDPDPLQTPRQPNQQEEDDQLSPLSLNVRSTLPENEEYMPSNPDSIQETPNDTPEDDDFGNVPGSFSQNILLQPPLPSSSPLFRPPSPSASPPPPSPSTILSDPSDISELSTRIPSKLYTRADELRQKARDEEKVRAQLDEERKLAERQGRTMDALRLKIKIRDMDAEAYKLHEKAARRYFVARNPQAHPTKIDVHGLRPKEAFDRIERAIVQANQENRTLVYVIVGKGLHSVNQVPTLKPAVLREMQRQKIPCEVSQRNPGQLIITLPRNVSGS